MESVEVTVFHLEMLAPSHRPRTVGARGSVLPTTGTPTTIAAVALMLLVAAGAVTRLRRVRS